MRERLARAAASIVLLLLIATTSAAQVSPLWGGLQPGPERVGFEAMFRFDPARTWLQTYDSTGAFVPDANGRPVAVHVWYPAERTGPCERMSFGSADDVSAAPPLAGFADAMRQRSREDARFAVPANLLDDLLSTPVHSCRGAQPAARDLPLVLYAGGLNAPLDSNGVLAEYLASHGFVVASISLVGSADGRLAQDRSAGDIEASVRDLEFASTIVRELRLTNGMHVAVVGHSLGAVAAMVFAGRHGNTRAAIGLDGTYGFEGSGRLLTTALGYDPTRVRANVLDIRRAEGEQQARLDLAPIRAMKYARRDFVTVDAMHHSDFTSFAMVAERFGTPADPKYASTGWNRRSAREGYETTAQLILELLRESLKSEPLARGRFEAMVRARAAVHWGAVAALPAPPTADEVSRLLTADGLERVKARFRESCGDEPPAACVDAERFNALGYALLGKRRVQEAIGVLELVAWAHPGLANAQDSLADAYQAAGDTERTRKVLQRAIELATADTSLGSAERARLVAEWSARIKALP